MAKVQPWFAVWMEMKSAPAPKASQRAGIVRAQGAATPAAAHKILKALPNPIDAYTPIDPEPGTTYTWPVGIFGRGWIIPDAGEVHAALRRATRDT